MAQSYAKFTARASACAHAYFFTKRVKTQADERKVGSGWQPARRTLAQS